MLWKSLLSRSIPHVVLVTGDTVETWSMFGRGLHEQRLFFQNACPKANRIYALGNHDIYWPIDLFRTEPVSRRKVLSAFLNTNPDDLYGKRIYPTSGSKSDLEFGAWYWHLLRFANGESILIAVLDSTRSIWLASGEISADQMAWLGHQGNNAQRTAYGELLRKCEEIDRPSGSSRYQDALQKAKLMVMIHHHPLPPQEINSDRSAPTVGRLAGIWEGTRVFRNAHLFLRELFYHRPLLILHGHKHTPALASIAPNPRLRPVTILSSGTGTGDGCATQNELERKAAYWQIVIPRNGTQGADRHIQVELHGFQKEEDEQPAFKPRALERVRRDHDELVRYSRFVHCHADCHGNIAAEELIILKCYPDSGPLHTWRHDIATRPIGLHDGYDGEKITHPHLRYFSCSAISANGAVSGALNFSEDYLKVLPDGHGKDARFSIRVKLGNGSVQPDTYSVMLIRYFIDGELFREIVGGNGPTLEFYMDRPTTIFRFTVTRDASSEPWLQNEAERQPQPVDEFSCDITKIDKVPERARNFITLYESVSADIRNLMCLDKPQKITELAHAIWGTHIRNQASADFLFDESHSDLRQGHLVKCKVTSKANR